ncbi:MAG: substrate-binding domain-containing protein [Beutenbergiaceae bacterium]
MRSRGLFATIAAVAALSLAACSSTTPEGETDTGADGGGGDTGDGEFTIGISMSTLENPFFVTVKDGAVAQAEAAGLESLVADAQNDTQKQLNDVQDLITKGIDALVINPVEPESATPIVELANDNDIPVITVDRSSSGGTVTSHIASDNVLGGYLICEWLGETLNGEGNLAVLEGIAGTSPELDRDEGCNDALTNYPGIVEVASQPADWDRAMGYTTAQNIIQANPDLDAIFGRNDLAALGAVEAVQEAGLADDILVISFDGIQDALDAVEAGTLAATVVQDPTLMGATAVDTAITVLEGGTVDELQELEVKVANAENIGDFM